MPRGTFVSHRMGGWAVMAISLLGAALVATLATPVEGAVGQVRVITPDYAPDAAAAELSGRGQAAPGMAVDPINADRVVEVHHDVAAQECEYRISTDGGRSWSGGELEPPAGFPEDACPAIDHGGQSLGQQSVAFGSGNRVYVSWASPPSGSGGYSVLLSTSTDGGATFSPASVVLPAGGGLNSSYADPELVVDRRTDQAGDDQIYIATGDVQSSRAVVVRSDNSGAAFGAPVEASNLTAPTPVWNGAGTAVLTPGDAYARATELSQPVLGPVPRGGGTRPLYLAWVAIKNDGACPPSCERRDETAADGYLVVAKSTDLAATWSRTRAVNVRGAILQSGDQYGPGSIFPRIAAGGGGDLYMVFNQGPGVGGSNNCGVGPYPSTLGGPTRPCSAYGPFTPADHAPNWDRDVYFIRSIDGGATWSDLEKLNPAKRPGLAWPEVIQTRHPQVFVAADGRVDVVWHDRRHWYLGPSDRKATPSSVHATPTNQGNFACLHAESNCSEARLSDIYYARSRDRGVSFTPSRRLDDRSTNLDVGYPHRVGTPRDYGPALAHLGGDELLVAGSDTRRGNGTARASYLGPRRLNQAQDIFLRRVSLNAPPQLPTVPLITSGSVRPPAFSVALSRHTYPGGSEVVPGDRDSGPRPWTRPVIVNEADMPAALAGGVLARANLGPVLASPVDVLPADVSAEVARLDSVGAFILGDTTRLSGLVEQQLVNAGVPPNQIVRITWSTSADLAANIAMHLDRRRAADKVSTPPLPAVDAVIIANPNSASAVSASALAANRRLPILYVGQNSVPASTANAIAALNVRKTLIVGSTGVISEAVATNPALPNPTRLGTGDQYSASDAVLLESVARGLPPNNMYVADGNEPMHGALLGAAAGRAGGLLTLAPGGGSASAESTVNALGLCPVVDRLLVSDLTGTAVVSSDPGDGTSGAGAGTCPAPALEPPPERPPPAPPADFDADGDTDVSVFRPSDGVWFAHGGLVTHFGTSGDIAVPADYDGDGDTDVAVFRPSNGVWFVQGGATTAFGTSGDIPVPGDYDGDGAAEIAVYRPSTGIWFVQGGATTAFGTSGDIPVPGDYDGDRDTDLAVFRPSSGFWFVHGGAITQFGTNGDIPVPGDYDGDGDADVAVFRPSNGYWFVHGGAITQFGASGDVPLPLPDAIRRFFFPPL